MSRRKMCNLHSSMERLKAEGGLGMCIKIGFTFQYGEIKRSQDMKRPARLANIYIPVWRD